MHHWQLHNVMEAVRRRRNNFEKQTISFFICRVAKNEGDQVSFQIL